MKLYTFGFTQKSAQEFFELLRENNIRRLVDIRINPSGQLSGFARKEDLPFLLDKLADHCEYVHKLELAPTKEILKDYREDHNWTRYVERFENLMEERDIPNSLDRDEFYSSNCCLLCSESTPEHCHRRLVAERLKAHWMDVDIIHL